MLRVYVSAPLVADAAFELDAAAARHVQVRRLQPGDALLLFDGRGGEWQAEVTAMGRANVDVRVLTHRPLQRDPLPRVTLAVGMPANERMDWLVEKAAELGAARIVPLQCERSVLRLSGERAAKRQAHWQAVAVAAAEQSGATTVTDVAAVIELPAWLAMIGADAPTGARWLLSPEAGPENTLRGNDALFLSGPEGGLTPAEDASARAAGFMPLNLGPRVLRAETAPLVALARALAPTV